MVIRLQRGANDLHNACDAADATATPSSLLQNFQNGYPFGTGLPRLSWKRPLNDSVCVKRMSKFSADLYYTLFLILFPTVSSHVAWQKYRC